MFAPVVSAEAWHLRAHAALVPLAVGAIATTLLVPTGDAYARGTLDPAAQRLVCTEDTPRVCVSRAHEGLLPEVAPRARHALALLSAISVVQAHEDTTTYSPPTAPEPRPDTALMQITVDSRGHLAHPQRFELAMLIGAFVTPPACKTTADFDAATAAAYWLLDREPTVGLDGALLPDRKAVDLWKDLKQLPRAEAQARVVAVHRGAQQCRDTSNLLSRSAR